MVSKWEVAAGRVVEVRARMIVKTLEVDRSRANMMSSFPRWRSPRRMGTGKADNPSVKVKETVCMSSTLFMKTTKRM